MFSTKQWLPYIYTCKHAQLCICINAILYHDCHICPKQKISMTNSRMLTHELSTTQLINRASITRSHGSVRVLKDDRQSQWEMAKFDSQPTLNPWTDRHQIWNTWLRRGYLLPKKNLGSIRPGDFAPHIPEIYTQNLRMFTSLFLKVLLSPYRQARWTDFHN